MEQPHIDKKYQKPVSEKQIGRAAEMVSLLGDLADKVKEALSLMNDAFHRRYKVSLKLKAALAMAILYFLDPYDVIPDFIPVVGYGDDVAVWAWVLNSFNDEITDWRTWKASQKSN